MPYKNSIKTYKENCYYHCYARGINKMSIYNSVDDYNFFKYLLNKYLNKDFTENKVINNVKVQIPSNTVHKLIQLKAYCLMKNHFHLLLYNIDSKGMPKLMRRLLSNYVKYYNTKYARQGSLIQGGYRAVEITSEEQLITVLNYIHLNPYKDNLVSNLLNYDYYSYPNYYFNKSSKWLKIDKNLKNLIDWKNLKQYANKIKTNEEQGFY